MTDNSSTLPTKIRIATRKSQLALWQANHVAALIQSKLGLETELILIVTKGDRILDIPLAEIGGKGLFLKEIEDALLKDEADIAVHSMKDVPSAMIDDLVLAAMLEREDPTDALVGSSSIDALPQGAIVGTASLRRQCQIKALRPDVQIKTLRGNVNTRLAKLQAKEYDAIILATAGLLRLDFEEHIGVRIDKAHMLPAVAQGCVGIQCRTTDTALIQALATLEDSQTAITITAERHCNEALGGSCQAPIAVHGTFNEGVLHLEAMVGNLSGSLCRKTLEAKVSDKTEAAALGLQLAELLFASGARELLAQK